MKETFSYKGYSVKIEGPINHWGDLRVVAKVTASPKASRQQGCPCAREGYLQIRSGRVIDRGLGKAAQEALAKQLAPSVKKYIKAEIESHIRGGCFTPIGKKKS